MESCPKSQVYIITADCQNACVKKLRAAEPKAALLAYCTEKDDANLLLRAGVDEVFWAGARSEEIRIRIQRAIEQSRRSLGSAETLALRKSNQFLHDLVDSAVDAIVAIDRDGVIILFNKGAEALFGYTAEEAIHCLSITTLYSREVATQLMKMLRSQGYGGVGRLQQIRREVSIKSGDLVPVNMTAAILFQDKKEVATVVIFSDLRDRIRIEQRLLQAQGQLKEEKQRSLLAELAGATAHELNQPLTSIIGYTQLIEKTAQLSEAHLRYTQTIISEAERMADIVKKVGRITHCETVSYVGSTNIVDLDRSLAVSESAPVPALVSEFDELTTQITLEQIAESREEEMRAQAPDFMRQSEEES